MYTEWRKKARESAGVSVDQARQRLHVSPAYFYDFEIKGHDMPYEIEMKMAELYGVSHHFIRYGECRTINDSLAQAYGEPKSVLETIRRRYAAGILPGIKINQGTEQIFSEKHHDIRTHTNN